MEGAVMSDQWQTIEQAAVTLGLSVRTVNRHITNGKLQSRLFEGRREVLIPSDVLGGIGVASNKDTAASTATSSVTPNTTGSAEPSTAEVAERVATAQPSTAADQATASSSAAPDTDNRQRVTAEVAADKPLDLQTMLTLADSIDDKATLAVAAYQTLARSAELQAQGLRKVAFGAWASVGVLAVGVVVATGWGMRRLTLAESHAEQNARELAFHKENAQTTASRYADELRRVTVERDTVRSELATVRSEGDVLRGRVQVLTADKRWAEASVEMATHILRQGAATQPTTAPVADRPSPEPTAGPVAQLEPATRPSGDQALPASIVVPAHEPGPAATRPTAGPASKPFAATPRAGYSTAPDVLDPR
jgi:hypothetical protein